MSIVMRPPTAHPFARHVRWCSGGAAEGVILEAGPHELNAVSCLSSSALWRCAEN
jgi:hypothetical protein